MFCCVIDFLFLLILVIFKAYIIVCFLVLLIAVLVDRVRTPQTNPLCSVPFMSFMNIVLSSWNTQRDEKNNNVRAYEIMK